MVQTLKEPALNTNHGHDWKIIRGSNVTFKCSKCDVLGHSEDLSSEHIIPNRYAPYHGDCILSVIDGVMSR